MKKMLFEMPWRILLSVALGLGWAFGSSPAEITREDAMASALRHSADLRVAFWEKEQAVGNVASARGALWPQLSVVGTAEVRDSALIDRAPDGDQGAEQPVPERAETPIARDSYSARLEMVQTVFAGFERSYGYRASRFREDARSLALFEKVLELFFSVNVAFDRVLAADTSVESRSQAVDRSEQLVAFMEGRYRHGKVEEYQVLQARSQLMQARVDYQKARVDAEDALARLLELIGWDGPLRGEGSPGVRGKLESSDAGLSMEADVSQVLRENPRLRGLALERRAAGLETTVARRVLWPRLEVYANLQSRSSYFDSSENLTGWASGVVVRWNLFDGFASRGKARASYARERQLAEREKELFRSLSLAIPQNLERLAARQRSLDTEKEALTLARRALEMVRDLHALGQVDVERLLRAEDQLAQAEDRHREALLQLNETVHQLDFLSMRHAELARLSMNNRLFGEETTP